MQTATHSRPAGRFIPAWLIERGNLSPGALIAYVHLAYYAVGTDTCHPTQTQLAHDLRRDVRQIRRWLRELRNAGLIDYTPRRGAGVTTYQLRAPADQQGGGARWTRT